MTIVDSARSVLREHKLAGDGRAGIWARKMARTKQRKFVQQHWRSLLLFSAFVIAVIMAAALLAPNSFSSGFLLGGGLASLAGALVTWVIQVTGTAPTMMGDLAEQWTASELRKLRRHGWRVVNHLCLRTADIDHVLIGPGGVFAIETKWSGSPWTDEFARNRIERGCRQVEGNARDLRLWTEFKEAVSPAPISPVLVLWGPEIGQMEPSMSTVADATVVAGPALHQWRAALPTDVLTRHQADAAWKALDRQASVRDSKENARTPLPPSLHKIVLALVGLVLTGVVGSLAALQLLRLSGSIAVGTPLCLLLAVLAVPGRRWKLGKYLSLAWQSGICFAILDVVAYVLFR